MEHKALVKLSDEEAEFLASLPLNRADKRVTTGFSYHVHRLIKEELERAKLAKALEERTKTNE